MMPIEALRFIQWLLDITPLLTVQLVVVLLLRRHVADYFGSRVAYQLWMLPLVWTTLAWFVINWSKQLAPELTLLSIDLPAVSTLLTGGFEFTPNLDEFASAEPRAWILSELLWPALFVVWLGGFVSCIVFHAGKLMHFRAVLKKFGHRTITGKHQGLLLRTGFPASTPVWYFDGITSPAIYGIFRAGLLLPNNFDELFDPRQQEAVLAHEFVHYSRRDNSVNFIALLLATVFWFNPIFLIALRYFRLDQELSSDARVLAASTREQRRDYAQALISAVDGKNYANYKYTGLPLSNWGSSNDLKKRTALLNSHHRNHRSYGSKLGLLCGLALVGTIGCTAVATSVATTAATNGTGETSSASTSINMLRAEIIPAHILEILSEANQESIKATAGSIENIPADSEYIVFVLDTSGSMTNNPSWGLMQQKLITTMDLYPQLIGVQVMNDMGDYLFDSTRREWIADTPEARERIIAAVRLWNPYSNSSPVEGIEEAVSNLPAADGNISIYVMGDDFQPDGSIEEVATRVDLLNRSGSDSSRRARIHTIMFPTIFAGPARYRGSADNYIALMRSIAQRSGGTFEILGDYQ